SCPSCVFARQVVPKMMAVNISVNGLPGRHRRGGQVGRQRRITVPFGIEGPLIEKMDRLVERVSFIDVIDVGKAGADRGKAEEGGEENKCEPENRIVASSQHAPYWAKAKPESNNLNDAVVFCADRRFDRLPAIRRDGDGGGAHG